MAKLNYKNGFTSVILRVKVVDSDTGAAKTGLTSASSGLRIAVIADNEPTSTAYTAAGSTIETITTLGTFAAPTATKCRFKEVDATNHPGVYEIQIADARWAVSNARSVIVTISGATGAAQVDSEIQLEPVPANMLAAANNVITAAVIADDAITAAKLATGCITASKIANSAITAAGISVNAIASTAISNGAITAIQSGLATQASVNTIDDFLDTEIAAIKAVTDALPNAGALTTIQADLDDIQARLPAALVSGRIDASVGVMAADVLTSSALAASAVTEIQAGLSTHAAADVWAVGTRVLTAGTNIALAKGTGVTGFNDLSAAQVNAEVDTALVEIGLDHLLAASVAGADVTDNSILAKLVSKSATADWDSFANTTDALEALRDRGDAAWTTATGFSTHSASDVWAVGARTLTAATNITSTGGTTVPQTGDSFARLGAPAGASVSADVAAVKGETASLLARLGAFAGSGLNTVLGFLRAMARKDASLTPSDMGGNFDNTTDSEEAIRDRGDAAWATAAGFSTHTAADVWAVATRVLTAGTNIALAKGTGVTGFNDISAAQVNTEADAALADVGLTTTITGRIDAAVSTRASQTSVDTIDDFLDTEVAAIKAKTDLIPASPAAVGSAMTLTSGERDAVATALLDLAAAIETGLTLRQAMRLVAAASAGKLSGAATTTVVIRNAVADSKARITATVTADGDRTAISTDTT